jgi:hypothetical protein
MGCVAMQRILFHPITALFVTGVAVLLWISFYLNGREISQSSGIIHELEQKVYQQEQDVKSLEEKVTKAKSPLTQEEIIRDQLLMQKPGEYVVQIPDLPEPVEEVKTVSTPLTPWEQWQELLGLE